MAHKHLISNDGRCILCLCTREFIEDAGLSCMVQKARVPLLVALLTAGGEGGDDADR